MITGADGYKTVDYPKLTAVLIEAVKVQQQEINVLRGDRQRLDDIEAALGKMGLELGEK